MNNTSREEVELNKALMALRLEVDGSIVNSIQEIVIKALEAREKLGQERKKKALSLCADENFNAGLTKAEPLVKAVLDWWKEHQYDCQSDGDGDELNVYDDDPGFVKQAKAIEAEVQNGKA